MTAHILIADDREEMRELYGSIVRDLEVDIVSSGFELLTLALARPYRLIITDLVMPGMSGAEFVQALRAEAGPNRLTPVYVCTGDGSRAAHEEIQGAGFDAVLEKPVDLGLLRRLFQWASEPDLPNFVRPID